MDTLFRSKKNSTRSSQSSQSTNYSTPYAQVSAGPSPVAGPSTYRRNTGSSSLISPPNSNPGLMFSDDTQESMPPPPPKDKRPPSNPNIPDFGGGGGRSSGRDSDAGSIRSMASARSMMPNTDLGRYPSYTGEAPTYRPTYPSRARPAHVSRVSEEFNITRPPDSQVEIDFQRLLENRDMDAVNKNVPSLNSRTSISSVTDIAKTTSTLTPDQKWQMVKAEAQGRWEASRMAERRKDDEIKSGKKRSGAIKNSPEWFLKKILDGSVTTQHIQTLTVSIRTSPLE